MVVLVVAQWAARLGFELHVDRFGRWVARLVAAAAVTVASIGVLSGGGPQTGVVTRSSSIAAGGLLRLQLLPVQAQSEISTAAAAGMPAFDVKRSGDGFRSSGGGLGAEFAASGAVVRAGSAALTFSSIAVGRGARLDPLRVLSVSARGDRAVFQRRGLSEWYAAGPLGIEQGFTLARRPAGAGHTLTLAIGYSGALRAMPDGSSVRFLTRSGRVALRYGGLTAADARGRQLPVTLTVGSGELLLGVADADAQYPLRIDPFVQQGSTITASDETAYGNFGSSVALSSDGSTALIGGDEDGNPDSISSGFGISNDLGAAWVFTRSAAGVWTQQGPKLTGDANALEFGDSVALSADGNTALVGAGSGDVVTFNNGADTGTGAAYAFTRAGGAWTLASIILPAPVASYGLGFGGFGSEVALSADGSTALIAGSDASTDGESWVFTKSGGTWSQQGPAFQGSAPAGQENLITDVALSSNGNTALIGSFASHGPDKSEAGTAWVYTRAGSSWSQQGPALSPSNPSGSQGLFGNGVALSGDGNTAIVGAPGDGSSGSGASVTLGPGAAYVFARSGATWTQQTKITAAGASVLGGFVGLSSDGSTLVTGAESGGDAGLYEFDRSGSTWTQQGTPFGLTNASDSSAAALSGDGGTAILTDSSTGDGVGSARAFARTQYQVSGTVTYQVCSDTSCSENPIQDQDIRLNGKTAGGAPFSAVDTSDAHGAWSIMAPPGSYTAAPVEDDDVTPVGPAFNPESISVPVSNADVPNQNFMACSGPADDNTAAAGDRRMAARAASAGRGGAAPRAVAGQFTEALCKAQYTLTVSAKIPQAEIVDPSLDAPYQHSTYANEPYYLEGTGTFAALAYGRALDSVLEQYPKYPQCYSEHEMEHMAAKHEAMDWYTTMSGGDLGSVTIPLVWNAHSGAVSFNGTPSEVPGSLKRTWHIVVVDDHHHTSCALRAQISPVVMVLPGAADAAGLVPKNAFTAVVLWYFPFDPGGEAPAPNTSAEQFLKALLGEEHGEALVKAWESLPWPLRFGFLGGLGTLGVKGVTALAHLNKLNGAASLAAALELLESIGHKLHGAHTRWDLPHFAESVAGVVGLMGQGDYPIMATVLRGSFDTKFTTRDTSNQYISYSAFGLSVKSTHFPDITVKIARQVQPNQDSVCPVGGAAMTLPWHVSYAGCPIVTNPFASHAPYMVMQNHKSYARGTAAVKALHAATNPLGDFKGHVRESGDLYSNFSVEQKVVPAPSCDKDGHTGGEGKPNTKYTMCWVFQDGRP